MYDDVTCDIVCMMMWHVVPDVNLLSDSEIYIIDIYQKKYIIDIYYWDVLLRYVVKMVYVWKYMHATDF